LLAILLAAVSALILVDKFLIRHIAFILVACLDLEPSQSGVPTDSTWLLKQFAFSPEFLDFFEIVLLDVELGCFHHLSLQLLVIILPVEVAFDLLVSDQVSRKGLLDQL
jgi:hypothetical protein